ncbi:DUF255 domain-containing protein [Bacillus halotolerans]|nr:DUF255 domain-containing protein [Bacillus halotolerans]
MCSPHFRTIFIDFPWEEKVFEKAQRENKQILVSIGYSTCH